MARNEGRRRAHPAGHRRDNPSLCCRSERIPENTPPLSDDEIRSIFKMWITYVMLEGGKVTKAWFRDILADVADTAFLTDYAEDVLKHLENDEAAKPKKDAKRREATPSSAQHLLKDGWLPFLDGLGDPDIPLWHQIATDFSEMAGDRLDAAYWILKQPDCDRATAYDFVVGMIVNEVLSYELAFDQANPDPKITRHSRFAAVLQRWEDGFYVYYSLRAGDHGQHVLSSLQADLDRQTKATNAPPLVLHPDFAAPLAPPLDDLSRSVGHGLYFSDNDGLVRLR